MESLRLDVLSFCPTNLISPDLIKPAHAGTSHRTSIAQRSQPRSSILQSLRGTISHFLNNLTSRLLFSNQTDSSARPHGSSTLSTSTESAILLLTCFRKQPTHLINPNSLVKVSRTGVDQSSPIIARRPDTRPSQLIKKHTLHSPLPTILGFKNFRPPIRMQSRLSRA
jgi:hypothetical protein